VVRVGELLVSRTTTPPRLPYLGATRTRPRPVRYLSRAHRLLRTNRLGNTRPLAHLRCTSTPDASGPASRRRLFAASAATPVLADLASLSFARRSARAPRGRARVARLFCLRHRSRLAATSWAVNLACTASDDVEAVALSPARVTIGRATRVSGRPCGFRVAHARARMAR
jgi:hypothetical protein